MLPVSDAWDVQAGCELFAIFCFSGTISFHVFVVYLSVSVHIALTVSLSNMLTLCLRMCIPSAAATDGAEHTILKQLIC